MFKKIEIWILYLFIVISILFAVGFGVLVRQELVGTTKLGWISEAALNLAEMPMNIRRLLSGQSQDLAAEDRYPNLEGFNGTPNSQQAYLLLSRYDGNIKEGIVDLVDLTSFEILHSWNPDIDHFNDLVDQVHEFQYLERDNNDSRSMLIHPLLTADGGLIFHSASPLRKIDKCSNLIMQSAQDIFHHSIEEDNEYNIWISSHLYPQSLSSSKVGRGQLVEGGFVDDSILKLSPEGEILYQKSVSQIFIENNLEYLLFAHGTNYERDPIHLNDIQPVENDGKYWKRGDVFLSLRSQSMIILYRPTTNEIIWKGTGPFFRQHDVNILDESRISVFNNNSKLFVSDTLSLHGNNDIVDGHNEVIIYDFSTDQYSSYLSNSLIENDVRTITQGRSKILPSGDLFVEETIYGRTLYFNADGSMRWSHLNRAGDGKLYTVGWSRILHNQKDTQTVKNFLESKVNCNE